MIDKLMSEYSDDYEEGELAEPMKRAMFLKFRDLIHETVSEFGRRGNFVRIYPSKGSKIYDKFFPMSKMLNKIIYKTFYSNDVLPYHTGKDRLDDQVKATQSVRVKMSQTISPQEPPKID